MRLLKTYILPRLLQWVVVMFLGITITFIIPRLLPLDPVEQSLTRISSMQTMDPRAVESLSSALRDMYGLQGTPLQQYLRFWGRLFHGDLGPSLGSFPVPVIDIIRTALPWTIGLLGTTTILSWILGLILGTLAGYFPDRTWSRILDKVVVVIYPIPNYILALLLLMVFTYYIPAFPLVGGARGHPSLSWSYIQSVFQHALLPATSLVIGGVAYRFIVARALTTTITSSDHVQYAKTAGLARGTIIRNNVIRNALLPQVTDLGLSLGGMFEGTLITEVVFGYPGIGYSLYTAIMQADYNMIMGVTIFSVVGIATAAMIIDLTYPLFDPRVRYT